MYKTLPYVWKALLTNHQKMKLLDVLAPNGRHLQKWPPLDQPMFHWVRSLHSPWFILIERRIYIPSRTHRVYWPSTWATVLVPSRSKTHHLVEVTSHVASSRRASTILHFFVRKRLDIRIKTSWKFRKSLKLCMATIMVYRIVGSLCTDYRKCHVW